jgi:hypothetical protein
MEPGASKEETVYLTKWMGLANPQNSEPEQRC